MQFLLTAGAVTAALFVNTVSADLCSQGSTLINGNYYCQAVKRIAYSGVGGTGSYNKITNMDSTSKTCSSSPHSYSGSLSPLDEDVSWHFRGPMELKQFAVYYPSSASTSSKKAKRSSHHRRHGHDAFHQRNKEIREIQEQAEVQERAVGDVVTATINGQVVSWTNTYNGATSAAAAAATDVAAAAVPKVSSAASQVTSAVKASTTAAKASSTGASVPAASGDWSRAGYYNADSGEASGLTFLAHFGGQGSGVFDMAFGNSLSYVTADGKSGCESPEVLKGSLTGSSEIALFSDKECSNGDCGYVRPGTVAYHGFSGSEKAFFMEFSMPDDGTSGWDANMPAAWILNAQIPRTLQYGQSDCSCWTTGCGEFDVFEVLDSGNTRCKSTLHGNLSGGDSDFFERPVDGTVKAAVVFHANNIVIQMLDNDFDFSGTITAAQIDSIIDNETITTSKFAIS